ncbi:hypothetical protein GCM10010342_75480 [Streptomyces anulatus]|nr:hypothetical protein GCM10010342_75480 [Streptomyces anulatus]
MAGVAWPVAGWVWGIAVQLPGASKAREVGAFDAGAGRFQMLAVQPVTALIAPVMTGAVPVEIDTATGGVSLRV